MAVGIHEAEKMIERARKLVDSLEAGDGRDAFSTAGYGEGDHAQGQRLSKAAEEALAEAKRPRTPALTAQQYARALRGWVDTRAEELKREGLYALAPKALMRYGMDLLARLRPVARGAVANEELAARCDDLKKWLDRWLPVARRVVSQRPHLAERMGVAAGAKPAAPAAEANAAG